MLSHPLCIIALVGHYPTNKLVQRSPLPGRNHTFDPGILSGITHSFPWLFRTPGYVTTRYSPFRRSQELLAQPSHSFRLLPFTWSQQAALQESMSEQFSTARLACLIHAANVHSEPESNPSIGICMNVADHGDNPRSSLRL